MLLHLRGIRKKKKLRRQQRTTPHTNYGKGATLIPGKKINGSGGLQA
jgi:hypothetical protein